MIRQRISIQINLAHFRLVFTLHLGFYAEVANDIYQRIYFSASVVQVVALNLELQMPSLKEHFSSDGLLHRTYIYLLSLNSTQ